MHLSYFIGQDNYVSMPKLQRYKMGGPSTEKVIKQYIQLT